MVIGIQTLLAAINVRKRRILEVAESSLPESQFRAFRRIFLYEFGEQGLEGELQKIYAENQLGKRNGRE